MTDSSAAPGARLFTAFGTVIYFDVPSGVLRHGPVGTSPTNAVYEADQNSPRPSRLGWLMHNSPDSREPIICDPEGCRPTSDVGRDRPRANATRLELIRLERGLIAFRSEGLFLCAYPDGRIALSARICSTWECFLASENWCTDSDTLEDEQFWRANFSHFDKKKIEAHIIHPLIRARTNRQPKAAKVLIYGYTKWSHGRVYYDLSRHLHDRGYVVDILDWQVNHDAYIANIIPYYDLFMTALDGAGVLADIFKIPYERIIALSHHELDIRMLIEQKGTEIFNRFGNYGVVSEFLYSASLMRGVRRIPMVTSLGINYSDFHAEIPERLDTIGYAGSMHCETYGIEWKRGELAEAAARQAGLAFKVAGSTENQISFHDMPEFYRTVDAVVTTSLSEGAGLPVMEAAAAGRLVIGTPVGHFPRRAYDGGGIIAPIEPEKFKAFTAATLKYYKDNPRHYSEKCALIQKSTERFDWKYCVSEWIDLIDRARAYSGTEHDREDKRKKELTGTDKIPDSNVSAEMESVFSKIYQTKGFGFSESASGPGSSLEKTKKLRNELPGYLKSFGIKTIVDAPCGDFNWMSRLNYEFDLYIGIDIVPDIIQNLRSQFSSKKVRFEVADICRSLMPETDAIFCRDCFTHMPFSKIQDAVRLFKQSGTRYLLTTTFPDEQNRDVAVGGWRPLNLQAEPFFWPVPVGLLREDFPDNADPWDLNKCIGIWVLSSLP